MFYWQNCAVRIYTLRHNLKATTNDEGLVTVSILYKRVRLQIARQRQQSFLRLQQQKVWYKLGHVLSV